MTRRGWRLVALVVLACGKPGDDCRSAGGTCQLGITQGSCAAPREPMDCNAAQNPGGGFCCLPCADGGTCQ